MLCIPVHDDVQDGKTQIAFIKVVYDKYIFSVFVDVRTIPVKCQVDIKTHFRLLKSNEGWYMLPCWQS